MGFSRGRSKTIRTNMEGLRVPRDEPLPGFDWHERARKVGYEVYIGDITGFDRGDKFASEDEVREYFTVDAMRQMELGFEVCHEGDEDESSVEVVMYLSQADLDEMADMVIQNRWWME